MGDELSICRVEIECTLTSETGKLALTERWTKHTTFIHLSVDHVDRHPDTHSTIQAVSLSV